MRKEENMESIKLNDEFIKLGQALKATGLADSGIDAKEFIQQGLDWRPSAVLHRSMQRKRLTRRSLIRMR